jgi:predicted metal-dependent phosphoesterase TrpH
MAIISKIDMHVHSTASDGASAPAELVRKAKQIGLELLSITDHDSVAGQAEAASAARDAGIHYITGVELSVMYKTHFYKDGKKGEEMHLLGYGFDPMNSALVGALEANARYRIERARAIVDRVNEVLHGEGKEAIPYEALDEKLRTVEGAFGRPHLAAMMKELGYVASVSEAFEKYLIGCDVPKRDISFEDGSWLIKQAGGIPVLAHPETRSVTGLKVISLDREVHCAVIDSMAKQQLIGGVECFYWDHDEKTAKFYEAVAGVRNLRVTGGTDHHGGNSGAGEFRERLGQHHVPDYVAQQFGVNL